MGPKIIGHTVIEKLMKWDKKKKKKCNKTSQDSRLQEDVRGKGYETRAFVRQFIHYKRVASLKLNHGERKGFLFHARMKNKHMAVIGHAKLG